MKKLYLIITLFIVCCSHSASDRAMILIKGYMGENISDKGSYEAVSFSSLDSSFCPDYNKNLSALWMAKADSLSREADTLMSGTFFNASASLAEQAEKLVKISGDYIKKSDSLKENAKMIFCGFEMSHSYRVRVDGAQVIKQTLFRLDPDAKEITGMENQIIDIDVNH